MDCCGHIRMFDCDLCLFWNRRYPTPVNASDTASCLPVIVLDAGHGGIDSGTSGADGTREKDINLAIAQKLEALLNGMGFQVVMTRTQDDLISDPALPTLRQRKRQDILKRLEIAQSYENSICISIHQNYYVSSIYSGSQVFYGAAHPENRDLAQALQSAIAGLLQPDNTRAVGQTGSEIYLLQHCMKPAVMVECGFMSNQKELTLLKNETYQAKMAFVIAIGLMGYLQT